MKERKDWRGLKLAFRVPRHLVGVCDERITARWPRTVPPPDLGVPQLPGRWCSMGGDELSDSNHLFRSAPPRRVRKAGEG